MPPKPVPDELGSGPEFYNVDFTLQTQLRMATGAPPPPLSEWYKPHFHCKCIFEPFLKCFSHVCTNVTPSTPEKKKNKQTNKKCKRSLFYYQVLLGVTYVFLRVLGCVCLGSIRNKNNWNNASKHLFGSYSHSEIPGFPFGLFCPWEQNSGNTVYSRIYSYSGISQTNVPLKCHPQ